VAPAVHCNGVMQRMLVVVFETRDKADEALDALRRLEDASVISVYAHAVVTKSVDATISSDAMRDGAPRPTIGGTAVGSLLGLLGGPMGLAVGAASGLVIGAVTEFARTRVARGFVADVADALLPGTAALVAEINEESTDPVDARMAALGGLVLRRARSDVAESEYERASTTLHARSLAMNEIMKTARKALHEKIQTQVKTALTKLEALKAKAESANSKAEQTTIADLLAKRQAIDRQLQELEKSSDTTYQRVKTDIESRAAELEKSVQAIEAKFKAA